MFLITSTCLSRITFFQILLHLRKKKYKIFYRHAYSLIINLKTLTQYIEYKEESLNEYEFNHLNVLQNNLRNYIINFFWGRYFIYLSQNRNLVQELQQIDQISRIIKPTTIRTAAYNIPVKTDYIATYNKRKQSILITSIIRKALSFLKRIIIIIRKLFIFILLMVLMT